jgi:hypothetical protein
MRAVVDAIGARVIDLVVLESNFWFQVPKEFVPSDIQEGNILEINITRSSIKSLEEDSEEVGGYIKNPPKKEFTE